jgi:hypothetical protein
MLAYLKTIDGTEGDLLWMAYCFHITTRRFDLAA